MPSIDINSFKSNFQDGAKPYLFYLYLNNPVASGSTDKNIYLVNTTSIPEGTIDQAETNWQGQVYKFGTTHTFSDWEVTFKVDKDARIHSELLNWQKSIHDPETNLHGNPSDYMANQEIVLLDGSGSPIKRSTIVSAWPTSVGAIELDYGNKDVMTFSVTFSYLYYKEG